MDSDRTAASRRSEAWTFFRQWLRRPLSTASVAPSSKYLARRIVAALPPETTRVIELGAGTGVFTRALLAHGVAPDDLLVVEFNPELHRYLLQQFPGVSVIQADARYLEANGEVAAFMQAGPAQAIVSGLGLLAMPKAMQRSVLAGAFSLLPPEGCFIQFTYGPKVPVAEEVMRELGLRAQRHGFTLRNLPPASVYVFTRARAVAVPVNRS